MSLQNLDNIPDRARKFFTREYVGPSAAKNASGCLWYFDNDHEDAKPTKTFKMDVTCCHYCGEKAYPIQANIRHGNYDTTGYMCCCDDAMDELENAEAIRQLKVKHTNELRDLEKQSPKARPEAKHKRLVQLTKQAEKYAQEGGWWRHGCVMRDISQAFE